jgi:hypothetical protein
MLRIVGDDPAQACLRLYALAFPQLLAGRFHEDARR